MISGIESGFDPSQIEAMRTKMISEHFSQLDVNNDGLLDETEASSMADKFSELTGQAITGEQVISQLDTDGDKQLNFDEFKAGAPKGPPPRMRKMDTGSNLLELLNILNESDEDEDGTASIDGAADSAEGSNGTAVYLEKFQSLLTNMLGSSENTESTLNLLV